MFCTQCGTKLHDDARFCPSCGAKIADQEIPASKSASDSSSPIALANGEEPANTPLEQETENDEFISLIPAVKETQHRSKRHVSLVALVALALALTSALAFAAYYVYTSMQQQAPESVRVETQQTDEQPTEENPSESKQSDEQSTEESLDEADEPIIYSISSDTVTASIPADPGISSSNREETTWTYSRIESSRPSEAVDKINDTIQQVMNESANSATSYQSTTSGTSSILIMSRSITVSYIDDDYVCFLDSGGVTGGGPHGFTELQGLCFSLKTGEAVPPYEVAGITELQLIDDTRASMTTYLDSSRHTSSTVSIISDLPANVSYSDLFGDKETPNVTSVSATPYVVTQNGVVYMTDQYAMGTYAEGSRNILVYPFEGGEELVGTNITGSLTLANTNQS